MYVMHTRTQFNQSVRIKSIVIKSQVQTQQPRLVKLFINRSSIGFSDVDGEAAQIIDLTEDVVTQGQRIPLRFVRFQNVNSLHVRCSRSLSGVMVEHTSTSGRSDADARLYAHRSLWFRMVGTISRV